MKNYIAPAMEVEDLRLESSILVGSPTDGLDVHDDSYAVDPGVPGNNLGKDDWSDIW